MKKSVNNQFLFPVAGERPFGDAKQQAQVLVVEQFIPVHSIFILMALSTIIVLTFIIPSSHLFHADLMDLNPFNLRFQSQNS
jgi:hypothetical protein